MRTRALLGVVLAAAGAALAAEPAAASTLTAEQVVERNAAARGGLEAWRKIRTMAWTGRVESATRGGGGAPFVLEQKRPDRTRFEVTVDGQKSVRAFDGTDGWKGRPGSRGAPEVQAYTADELRFARGAPIIEGPLMDFAAKGAAVTLGGVHEVEGRKAYALELRLASGASCRVWIDAESFLELRYDRELVTAQGRPVVTSVYFADYRTVEGLTMPFTIETGTSGGKARDRLVIERVALNPALDDRAFARPGPALRRRGVTIDTRSASRPAAAPPRL